MTTRAPDVGEQLERRLADLRESFDRSFADPPRQQVAGYDDLLAVRAGGQRYALRLTQAAGLFPDRPVTRLPGPLTAPTVSEPRTIDPPSNDQ